MFYCVFGAGFKGDGVDPIVFGIWDGEHGVCVFYLNFVFMG